MGILPPATYRPKSVCIAQVETYIHQKHLYRDTEPSSFQQKRSNQGCVLFPEAIAFWNWDWRAFEGKVEVQFVRTGFNLWDGLRSWEETSRNRMSLPGQSSRNTSGNFLLEVAQKSRLVEQYECDLLLWEATSLKTKKFGEEYIKFPPPLKKRAIVMEDTYHHP